MKLEYYPETDTLYIDLLETFSTVVLRFQKAWSLIMMKTGTWLALTSINASKKVSLKELTLNKLPIDVHTFAA